MNTEKKETKLKEKSKRERRARLGLAGPMYIDESLLDPNKHYIIANDTPGSIQRRLKMGYKISEDKNIQIGDKTATSPSKLGSAVTVDVGRSSDIKGVLMEMSKEDHIELMKEFDEMSKETLEGLGQDLSKEMPNFYGSINKTNR